ncbi:hypothetical protein [Desertibacillus haloalkaliphilus]|uniref:hypothetical protein n=1 Tax=Desertibacillus haloalkaliphilus TaxID=1328930 RepID=UPI001C26AE31|nr:hypothetical protein [Desertibacillus haloalkaliphilus]MBU8907432.1 hypothetical protein [Desertibacillus haloalkaliphilus]
MEFSYSDMSTHEIIAYYKRVKNYLDQGFRAEGLRDELVVISNTFKEKEMDDSQNSFSNYLAEIHQYLLTIRH